MASLVSCGKSVSKGNPSNLINPQLRPTEKSEPPLKSWSCKRTFGVKSKGLTCKPAKKTKTPS